MSYAPTLVFILAAANSMAWYSKKDLQQILQIILEAIASVSTLQLFVFLNNPYEKSLKAKFPNLYRNKIYI